MKKGQLYEGIVKYVNFPNKAVVVTKETDSSGMETEHYVTVKGALPGQKIKYMLKKARPGKCQGLLVEVLEKAGIETEKPACACFGICGGCNYQNIPYKEQLELKKNQVLKLINSVIDENSYIFDGILPSPVIWEYRNKMEFSFGDEYKGGPLALGLHKKGSIYDIVNAYGCKIVHSDYSEVIACVKEYFLEKNIPHYNKKTHTGILRHLLIRRSASTGELLVALVTTPGLSGLQMGLDELSHRLQGLKLEGSLSGFLHIINDGKGDVVKSDETRIIWGKDWFMEKILGLKFRISVFSFFQTNTKGAEILYQCVRNYISGSFGKNEGLKDKVVFDLYSGTGTIAQIIAPAAKKVTGVEIVEEAVEAAKKNAEYNGINNCEFIAGDVLEVINKIEEKPDFIILDPPREGVHPKALKRIINFGVEKIVYISCKPGSLARDLVMLQEGGYKVERMGCVDLFPQTLHVEVVCLLSKLRAKHNIEVELEMSEMDLTTVESKATYEEIKDYVLEHTGLKVSSLYISQAKRKCGLNVGQNYNLSKSENPKVPKCPPQKETAIMDALKYFK